MYSIAILLSLLIGIFLLIGGKLGVGLAILLFAAVLYYSLTLKAGIKESSKIMVNIILASIPFPYIMQFKGKDAFTITTFMIYCIFFLLLFVIRKKPKKASLWGRAYFILPAFIFLSFTISFALNPLFFWQSVRYYVAHASGIALYFLILSTFQKDKDIINAIKIIVAVLTLQSVITFIQYKFPSASGWLAMFGTSSNVSALSFVDGIARTTGTIGDYELLAQWFLIGIVFSVLLIYQSKRYRYSIPAFFCLGGMIFTKTRSDILLLVFMLLFIYPVLRLYKKDYKNTSLKIVVFAILSFLVLFIAFPSQINDLTGRLNINVNSSNAGFAQLINRKSVWDNAASFIQNPAVFGNGLFNIESLSFSIGSFHSLYMTLLFKIGIAGLLLHFLFWLVILWKALTILDKKRNSQYWYLVFFLFIAVIFQLLDGVKIEYLRYDHAIQFAWAVYGLLAVASLRSKEADENTLVS